MTSDNEKWELFTQADWLLDMAIAAYAAEIYEVQRLASPDKALIDQLLRLRNELLDESDKVSPNTPEHSKAIIRRLGRESYSSH